MNQIFLETRMFRLSDGEEIMTLAFFILIQYRSVTDRQTDGRTDGHSSSGYTSACITRYANALVKTWLVSQKSKVLFVVAVVVVAVPVLSTSNSGSSSFCLNNPFSLEL